MKIHAWNRIQVTLEGSYRLIIYALNTNICLLIIEYVCRARLVAEAAAEIIEAFMQPLSLRTIVSWHSLILLQQ
jgi:hypothetical protein